ncbi:MAG: insulinase family protein [Candidatus Aenigmarchaeota archaeon]|nr:insulinase family protein [Candidatus Aenigmarchaeota archaeon]
MYQVREVRYDNGLRLFIAEKPGSQEASLTLRLPYGHTHCPRETRQAAHFAEHMLFRSTPARKWKDRCLDFDTMAVEFEATAKTDRTTMSCTALPNYLSSTVSALFDLFQNRIFDEEEFERERETLEGEMSRRRGDPEVYGDDILFEVAFQDHPLGQENYDSVTTLRRQDLVEAKEKHYTPDNLVIAVAGYVPSETEDVIGQTFGSLQGSGLRKTRFSRPPQKLGFFREERDMDSSFLSRGWIVPGTESTDDLFALYFVEHLLGGSRDLYAFSSRIYYKFVTERGLGYTARVDYSAFLGCGIFRVELVGTNQKNIAVAKALIDEEIGRLKTEPIPEEEFETARRTLKIGESRNTHYSDSTFSEAISLSALKDLPTNPEFFAEQVDKLTPSQIMDVVSKYFTDQHATVEIVGIADDS